MVFLKEARDVAECDAMTPVITYTKALSNGDYADRCCCPAKLGSTLQNTQGAAMSECITHRQQKLTMREAEVIQLVAEGLTDKEIGSKLSISPKTVSEHVENVRGKLGATNRASAVYVFFVKMLGRQAA